MKVKRYMDRRTADRQTNYPVYSPDSFDSFTDGHENAAGSKMRPSYTLILIPPWASIQTKHLLK